MSQITISRAYKTKLWLRSSAAALLLVNTLALHAAENLITIVTTENGSFSTDAERLTDAVVGTDNALSWSHAANPWSAGNYPMTAVLALGGSHTLSRLEYFVGNLSLSSAEVTFETTNALSPSGFQPLVTVNSGHQWNAWRNVPLPGQPARFVRVKFSSPSKRFNISELRLYADTVSDRTDIKVSVNNGSTTYRRGESTRYIIDVANNGPAAANGATVLANIPGSLISPFWTCSGSAGAVCPEQNGTASINHSVNTLPAGGALRYVLDATVAMNVSGNLNLTAAVSLPAGLVDLNPSNNSATDTDQNPDTPTTDQPRNDLPGPTVVRAFRDWPKSHLSDNCKTLHDRYWVNGPNPGQNTDPNDPDNLAYQTWHPAIAVHPATGESCDFGHEHGLSPQHAPDDVFQLSGGWPAFGYAARIAGGRRHEDHVGHKVSVAHFRAAIGNGAGSSTLYDAGFECDWLSKIHQGSSSMDAFSNHLHEYYLTLRCMDGLNASGVIDNQTVGTAFSVKVMYTYGEPNKFVESNCSGEGTFQSSILKNPDGDPIPPAMQLTPIGNHSPNHRGFACSSSVLWKNLETEVQEVDLWTEFINIQRNDGSAALTIQPYYIVKNPARIIQGFDKSRGEIPRQVIRTIDLCYDINGNRQSFPYCIDAPDPKPTDWIGWQDPRSPFNGTFRAINFKASHLQNANGPSEFCTTASGHAVDDPPPCDPGHLLQKTAQFNNNWNNGRYAFGGRTGNVAGSIWAETPAGARFESAPDGNGGYTPLGLGYEFIIDNREPDDDLDGFPDGANVRGVN